MNTNLYSIKDVKVGFTTVFTAPNNAVAIRMFGESVTAKGQETLLNLHPEDFELYKIGEMNQENGEVKPECVYLEKALSFIKTDKK